MTQIQGAGGQPQKQPKYAPLYTGRIFNGVYTNRSPLRGALPSMYEQFYKMSYGDVMIAGSNVEVSNRLTLIRRPGNPNYDANTWNNVLSFDEFRVNKAASDIFGTTLEKIYTMVTQPGDLFSLDENLVKATVFASSNATGQSYMQEVGNSLYFSNGVENKKWLQSLFVRNSSNNNQFPQGTDGLAGTYPFGTFFIDPNNNIQEMIGISLGAITNVAITADVLTLTVTLSPDTHDYPIGTSFMLWGLGTATFLNGALITITAAYTHASSTTLVANFTHGNYSSTPDTGYVQQIGTTPVVAETGSSVPIWGTTVPASGNFFNGSITLDGNILWANRGNPVENWGIAAPTTAPTNSVTGTTTTGWKKGVYYSAPGVIIDANNNVWQVTTAGTTGNSNPFPANPTVGQTQTDGTVTWTCVSTHVSSGNIWQAHTAYKEGTYSGAYPWSTSTPENGAFLPDWKSGKFIIQSASGTPCLFMLQKNIPNNNVNVPISVVFGGGTVGTVGWTCQFFNHSNSQTSDDATHAGAFDLNYSSPGNPVRYGTATPATPTASATGVTSILWNFYDTTQGTVHPMQNSTMNGAGEVSSGSFTTPWAGMPAPNSGSGFEFVQYGKIRIPVDGMNVTFRILANSTCFFGIEAAAGATLVSFTPTPGGANQITSNLQHIGTRTLTAWNGYPILAGHNGYSNEYGSGMVITINFPTAGVYGIEFDYARAYGGEAHPRNYFFVTANGSQIVPESATTQPWFESPAAAPVWSSAAWNLLSASSNSYPNVLELSNNAATWTGSVNGVYGVINGNQLKWYNLGPATDFTWHANTPVTLPSTLIVDKNSNEQRSYESGVSGSTEPTWQTSLYALTADQAPLQWINLGSIPPVNNGTGKITATTAQGWKYWVALVNTLDQTVSNVSPASLGTGPVIAGQITIPAGSGLDINKIDPQADYVAIFRSTDGGATPLLVPGLGNAIWTVPLPQYLQYGYVDSTPDADLNELIQGAAALENTPPATGTVNLTYHLNRIWYSIGNTVWYTSGPNAPSGNGDGTSPLNFSQVPSQVRRLVPTAIGMLVFTVSDIYIIAGNGTASNPILPAIPYLTGVGLANYNALDINGGLIGFFTTDKQFVMFNPSAGLDYIASRIGDQLRLNNGSPGQSWATDKVYVSWYTNGEDQAWFLGDGRHGWYKLISTPSPETGICWSAFATVNGGNSIRAIKAIEVQPGVHKLLTGPSGSGHILMRDLDATTDAGTTGANGAAYPAYGVFGSYVLALPGQIAKIAFITTNSVKVGSPLVLGVLLDEALPYYKGSFDILKNWETDPPGLPESKSFWKQRFYLSDNPDETAYCSDMQIMVQWPAEAAQNELQSFTVWGAYEVEQ